VPTSPPEPDSPAEASRSPVHCRLPRTSTLSRRGHLGGEINMAFASSDRQVGPQIKRLGEFNRWFKMAKKLLLTNG